ncbi:MAG: hypothetical protein Q8T08_03080 [Ignavibacteria bacterium]|nr:hypothetical protein [Ignavibacteria bacterium]
MEYRKFSFNTKDIFTSLDLNGLVTDFDSGVTKVVLRFFENQLNNGSLLYEIEIQMLKVFIQDTYGLSNNISEESKVKAALDLGELIFIEKKGILQDIEIVIAQKAGARLRYIPKIDMKPIIK